MEKDKIAVMDNGQDIRYRTAPEILAYAERDLFR